MTLANERRRKMLPDAQRGLPLVEAKCDVSSDVSVTRYDVTAI